jgi:hypothetical protein
MPQPQLEHHTNGQENQEIKNSKKGRKEGSKEGEKARYTSRQVGYPAEALIFFLETPMPAAGLAAVWVFPIMPDLSRRGFRNIQASEEVADQSSDRHRSP